MSYLSEVKELLEALPGVQGGWVEVHVQPNLPQQLHVAWTGEGDGAVLAAVEAEGRPPLGWCWRWAIQALCTVQSHTSLT